MIVYVVMCYDKISFLNLLSWKPNVSIRYCKDFVCIFLYGLSTLQFSPFLRSTSRVYNV